jgi:hypothetical protein
VLSQGEESRGRKKGEPATADSWDYDLITKKLMAVGTPKHAYQMLADFHRKELLTGTPKPTTWLYDPDRKQ